MEPEELDALVAGNVRAARARRRVTQEELADDMGWTRAMVTFLESGTRRVTLADAVSLCAALELTLPELLHGAPPGVIQTLGID